MRRFATLWISVKRRQSDANCGFIIITLLVCVACKAQAAKNTTLRLTCCCINPGVFKDSGDIVFKDCQQDWLDLLCTAADLAPTPFCNAHHFALALPNLEWSV